VLYELATEIFSDITIDFEEIEWTDPSGERRRRRILEAALIGSSNSEKTTFKEPLSVINNPGLSQEERVNQLDSRKKENFLEPYTEDQRKILEKVIELYKREGTVVFDVQRSIRNQEFKEYNILEFFAIQQDLLEAVKKVQNLLYS
jgi:hypothetical protein